MKKGAVQQGIRKICLRSIFLFAVLILAVWVRGFERTVEDIAGWWVLSSSEAEVMSEDVLVESLEEREWGIVLGASIQSGHFRERVSRAADLWKAGKVEKLLLTGDGRERFYDEPSAMQALLLKLGIPEEVMVLDRAGLSTFDSMERAARIHGVREAWVVTQQFHGPRAVFLAKHQGIRAATVAASHPGDVTLDEQRERKARVKAVLQVLGLADTAMGFMKRTSPRLDDLAMR